jgi:hypothetical protein
LAALHPAERDAHRPSKYSGFVARYDWSGIEFPTPLAQVKKWEQRNAGVRVNVWSLVEKQVAGEKDYYLVL